MSEFLQRVEVEIQNRKLLLRGQKILVAVSGGVDSMVLLHTLHSHAVKNRWKIFVAHFNHQLRGCASDADEKLVRVTAKKLRLKFFTSGADVKAFAAQSKLSIEMAARKLRHEFLAKVAREQKISAIALAHHADDQVELFFLRLLRGAGGESLAGMKWRSPSPADKKISLVRPLLGCAKAELLAFAGENKICFREDTSNFSTDFLRNKIRNELLPLLRKNYQPAVDKTVLRVMEIVGAEAELVGSVAQKFYSSRGDEAQIEIETKLEPPHVGCYNFEALPLAVQRRVLQSRLVEVGVVSDFELVEQLRAAPGKFISVSSGVAVACDEAGNIQLRRESADEFNLAEQKLNLRGRAGRSEFGGRKFQWQIQPQKNFAAFGKKLADEPSALREFFDADKVGGEIILRHWRAGDRFQPIGLKSAVKLQDLFVNAKIPSARRRELVLATTLAGEIFWVEDLRMGERFKLTPGTQRRLCWSWAR